MSAFFHLFASREAPSWPTYIRDLCLSLLLRQDYSRGAGYLFPLLSRWCLWLSPSPPTTVCSLRSVSLFRFYSRSVCEHVCCWKSSQIPATFRRGRRFNCFVQTQSWST